MSKKKAPVKEIIPEEIEISTLDDIMGDRFDIYAKEVIQDRAIPDVRDGLKPVQRRIIYVMDISGNTIDKPTKKCAHIVGGVMGDFHPHGDSSIYEALVRMSQPWNMRLPLIDFQGNNGSIDGDGAAAMRYTEARLSALSNELVRDLDKSTVDMALNYDDSKLEPTVLPSRFPSLLVNGAKGIAVGMATEIPPHNLKEVCSTIIYRINHPNCPIESLLRLLPGPDFPTGGIVYKSQGLSDIYLTGKGRIDIASKTEIVEGKDLTQIIVSEIPYQVNKSTLVREIDKIRHDKIIAGIAEVRDESDKDGTRIAIDIAKGGKAESVLTYLLSKTQLRISYSANMVAIVDGRPMTLNLQSYADAYITHQRDVITRRSKYELGKDQSRLLIVEGLIKASSIIDEVIKIIRGSADKADCKKNLEERYGFTSEQSEAIVTMQLYKLSHTDTNVLLEEAKALKEDIARLQSILSNPEKLDAVIVEDLKRISKTYGDERRTTLEEEGAGKNKKIDARDLIAVEDCYVTVSRDGYLKRSSLASYKGSGGHNGVYPGLKEGDTLIYEGLCRTKDFLLMFTSKGQYLYVPIHVLKANKWLDEGLHVNYAVNLPPEEKIIKAFTVSTFRDDLFIVVATKMGFIKRMKLSSFPSSRYNRPFKCIKTLSDDQLVGAVLTSGDSNLMVFSKSGLASFYNENEIGITGTGSGGVKAANFKGKEVAGLLSFLPNENGKALVITNLGYTRFIAMASIKPNKRQAKGFALFSSFKYEPHNVIFVDKLQTKEPPLKYTCVLKSGKLYELTLDDFRCDQNEYARRPSSFKRSESIATVYTLGDPLIDEKTVSNPLPIKEEEAITETTSSENGEDIVSVKAIESPRDEEDEGPVEKFEQISIFDDN